MKDIWEKLGSNLYTPVSVSVTLPTEQQWPRYIFCEKISNVAADLRLVLINILVATALVWKGVEGEAMLLLSFWCIAKLYPV